jgi:hypothetical protein
LRDGLPAVQPGSRHLGGRAGGVLDEPATARALAGYVLRGLDCGAIDPVEAPAPGPLWSCCDGRAAALAAVVLPDGERPAAVLVRAGRIAAIEDYAAGGSGRRRAVGRAGHGHPAR